VVIKGTYDPRQFLSAGDVTTVSSHQSLAGQANGEISGGTHEKGFIQKVTPTGCITFSPSDSKDFFARGAFKARIDRPGEYRSRL
jgi:hypothetical protein